jgi:translation initiation factor 5B
MDDMMGGGEEEGEEDFGGLMVCAHIFYFVNYPKIVS